MKTSFIAAFVLTAAGLIAGCSHQSKEEPAAASAEKSAAPESHVKRGTNGDVIITLDATTQKTMGLQLAPLTATEIAPEVSGVGHVVDPVPLAEMLIQLFKAQLVFDNSHQELERMKVLRQDNNASERAFQTTEATYLQNQADLGAIRLNIKKTFGGRVADLIGPLVVSPGTERKPNPLLGDIADANGVCLVRVDVPASEALRAAPGGARIAGLGEGDLLVRAEFFGDVPVVDPQTQSRGYFFLVTTNQSRFTPGMAVTAFIELAEQARSGVVVPREAVVRFNGATWIYLQIGEEAFQRTSVALQSPLEKGWFVREGLKPQDKVVTVGAQQLLSEELKGQIGGD